MFYVDGKPEPEENRTPLHEAGHSLVALVFTGRPSTIYWYRDDGGLARASWDDAWGLCDSDLAFAVFEAHLSLAGVCAEELAYGAAHYGRCMPDICGYYAAEKAVRNLGMRIERRAVERLIKFWLKRMQRSWRCMAGLAYPDARVVMPRLLEEALRTDESGLVRHFHESPLLLGKHDVWRERLQTWRDAADKEAIWDNIREAEARLQRLAELEESLR